MSTPLLLFVSGRNRMTKLLGYAIQCAMHGVSFRSHGHGLQATDVKFDYASFVVLGCLFCIDVRNVDVHPGYVIAVGKQGLANHVVNMMLKTNVVLNVTIGLELNLHTVSWWF